MDSTSSMLDGSSHLKLPMLAKAREDSGKAKDALNRLLQERIPRYESEDTNFVVFGSLARGEWTSGSDLDWTYLVDGQANSDHRTIAQEIRSVLSENKEQFRPPSATGTFGNLTFSHDIVHQIGGQHDTNRNTTQRILLLLESTVIGKETQAYDRVVTAVINRYLEEDTHLLTEDETSYRVPRFLLNDIVRFWRTMAVDFASKQRDRGGEGWGLRNAKLRMSRKLIFASGLLVCFSCNLNASLKAKISTQKDGIKANLTHYITSHIREYVKLTPLQIMAQSFVEYGVPKAIQDKFFSSYSAFIELLGNERSRIHLENLRAGQSRIDPSFQKVKEISRLFEASLDYVFFEHEPLKSLTRKFGVF